MLDEFFKGNTTFIEAYSKMYRKSWVRNGRLLNTNSTVGKHVATVLRSLDSSKILKIILVMLRGNTNPDKKVILKGLLKAVGTKHAASLKKIVTDLNINRVKYDVDW